MSQYLNETGLVLVHVYKSWLKGREAEPLKWIENYNKTVLELVQKGFLEDYTKGDINFDSSTWTLEFEKSRRMRLTDKGVSHGSKLLELVDDPHFAIKE